MWGEEAAAVMAGFWRTIDTVLMGRKTFEVAVQMGQANGYPGVRNYVFSLHERLRLRDVSRQSFLTIMLPPTAGRHPSHLRETWLALRVEDRTNVEDMRSTGIDYPFDQVHGQPLVEQDLHPASTRPSVRSSTAAAA